MAPRGDRLPEGAELVRVQEAEIPPLVAHSLKGIFMCVGKTHSEVVRTCTSTCKNFSRCSARIAALAEAALDTETPLSKHLDHRTPAVSTKLAPPQLVLVHSL